MTAEKINGMDVVGHIGGAPGMSTSFDIYPALGFTVVIVSAQDGAAVPVRDEFRKHLLSSQTRYVLHRNQIGLGFFHKATEVQEQIPPFIRGAGLALAVRGERLARGTASQQRVIRSIERVG